MVQKTSVVTLNDILKGVGAFIVIATAVFAPISDLYLSKISKDVYQTDRNRLDSTLDKLDAKLDRIDEKIQRLDRATTKLEATMDFSRKAQK